MIVCYDIRTGTGCGKTLHNGVRFCAYCGTPLRAPLTLHDPGTLIGTYTIRALVGHGAFGAVYQASHPAFGAVPVALKQTFDPGSIRSFQHEFAALHRLQHPNLPRYIEVFEANGDGYLAMEFVPGLSLEDILAGQHNAALPEQQVLGYAVQLCDVLTFLHQQQLFHRDIKPANVRLTAVGLIKLVDFGLLKQGTGATQTIGRALTPAYAPLEQWTGQGTNQQSDLYSLGATFYHLLTGHEPPQAIERLGAASDPLIPPHALVPTISPHVSDAIVAAMALDARNRFADAVLFKHALTGSQQHRAATPLMAARPATPPIPATPRPAPSAPAMPPVQPTLRSAPPAEPTIHLPTVAPQLVGILAHAGNNTSAASVVDLSWCPDGKLLATLTGDGAVHFWQFGKRTQKLKEWRSANPSFRPTVVRYSPNGRMLAVGGETTNGAVLLLQSQNMRFVRELLDLPMGIASLAFSPNNEFVAAAGKDHNVRLWKTTNPKPQHTLWGHSRKVTHVAFSADSKTLFTADDVETRMWNVANGGFLGRLPQGAPLDLQPNGPYVALQSGIWHTGSQRCVQQLAPASTRVLSPDWQYIARDAGQGRVDVVLVADERLIATLAYTQKPVLCLAYSHSGKTIAVGHEGAALLWQLP